MFRELSVREASRMAAPVPPRSAAHPTAPVPVQVQRERFRDQQRAPRGGVYLSTPPPGPSGANGIDEARLLYAQAGACAPVLLQSEYLRNRVRL